LRVYKPEKRILATDKYRFTNINNALDKFFGSSDFGVINKILKKQYDMPINHLADYKIITTFSFL